MTIDSLSTYERRALREIQRWKRRETSWLGRVGRVAGYPFELAGKAATAVPGVSVILEKSVGGLVSLLNDAAQWSVRPEAVYRDFGKQGLRVLDPTDIYQLDLKQVDRVIGYLGAKYKTLALAEGSLSGAMGAPGIPADVVAIVSLTQRCAGEYATYCGFDVSAQHERLFAMHLLSYASLPEDGAKQAALAQLSKIATEVAKRKTWKELERHAFVRILKRIAEALGVRLTKAKLAQIIPALGAAVGGGYNAYFVGKLSDAAYHLYRQRFLAEKYGAAILEA